MKRFCSELDFGKGYILRGCGPTIEEARRKLIDAIRNDKNLFEPEKEQLIKQIAQPFAKHLSE